MICLAASIVLLNLVANINSCRTTTSNMKTPHFRDSQQDRMRNKHVCYASQQLKPKNKACLLSTASGKGLKLLGYHHQERMVDNIKAVKPNSNHPCENCKHILAQLPLALPSGWQLSVLGLLLHNFPNVSELCQYILLSAFTGTVTDRPGRADLRLLADSNAPVTDNMFALGIEDWTGDLLLAGSEDSGFGYIINLCHNCNSGYFYINKLP